MIAKPDFTNDEFYTATSRQEFECDTQDAGLVLDRIGPATGGIAKPKDERYIRLRRPKPGKKYQPK